MILLDIEQGSPGWTQARLGLPTASQFSRIITPAKLTLSSQADKYRNELLAEWLCGYPLEIGNGGSGYTERGTDMEAEARDYYELQQDVEVQRVGFVYRDENKLVGGSPDGLVGDDGGVDFKCPAIHNHIGYMLHPEDLADTYRCQVQSYLYLTERAWWDVVSYNPALPGVRVRVERDEKFQSALDGHLYEFVRELEAAKLKLAGFKQVPPWLMKDEAA